MVWEDFQSEHHRKSRWREEKQADQERGGGGDQRMVEREVAGHEDVWMRRG